MFLVAARVHKKIVLNFLKIFASGGLLNSVNCPTLSYNSFSLSPAIRQKMSLNVLKLNVLQSGFSNAVDTMLSLQLLQRWMEIEQLLHMRLHQKVGGEPNVGIASAGDAEVGTKLLLLLWKTNHHQLLLLLLLWPRRCRWDGHLLCLRYGICFFGGVIELIDMRAVLLFSDSVREAILVSKCSLILVSRSPIMWLPASFSSPSMTYCEALQVVVFVVCVLFVKLFVFSGILFVERSLHHFICSTTGWVRDCNLL